MTTLLSIAAFVFLVLVYLLVQFGFLAAVVLVAVGVAAFVAIICAVGMFVVDLVCEPRQTDRA